MDKIFLQQVQLNTHIGVPDEERMQWQTLLADVEMEVDLYPAGSSDNIKKTIDYAEVVIFLQQFAKQSEGYLLEKLAEDMSYSLIQQFSLQAVTLRLTKPAIIPGVAYASIEIKRTVK